MIDRAWALLQAPRLAFAGGRLRISPSASIHYPKKTYLSEGCRIYKGAVINGRGSREITIKLGRNVKIHEYTYLDSYDGYIEMDDFSGVGHHCVLGGQGGLRIGKYSMISGLTYIVPANHIFTNPSKPYQEQGETRQGISIGDNVWIGASCVILDGVCIGNNSVVGAGSVVKESIPHDCLAVGSPSRIVKEYRDGVWVSVDH